FGWIVRLVGHHGCEPDEKRLTKVGIDEVVDRLHRLTTDHQSLFAMTPLGGHAVGETALGEMPFPELARLEASIAGFLEQAGNGGSIPQEGKHGAAIHPFGRIIAANPVLMSVKPREKRG